MDILFQEITAIPMSPSQPQVLSPVNVGIKDGAIAYIGGEMKKARRIINGFDKVLMPAFINCHTHSPMCLLRGFAGDLALHEWLFEHIIPAEKKLTPEMVYYGALLSIAEMVSCGTVSFSDMYFGLDSIAKAVAESGVKANLSNAVVAMDRDYDFYRDKCYSETMTVIRDFQGAYNGRIRADAGIHAQFTSFDRAWLQTVEFAQKYGLNMHLHLSETRLEHEKCKEDYGCTPTEILYKHQVFDVPTIAAHCVWVEESDLDILAAKKVCVSHNPISNLKLASGVAPVSDMLAKGVTVALGTDGMAANNSYDLFEEMKVASLLQKYRTENPSAVPAIEALKMATINGAAAQGRQNECGQICVGMDADLIALDFHSAGLTFNWDTIANIVYACTGRNVAMTLCQGKILYENGEFLTLDLEKILYEAKQLIKTAFDR